MKSMTAQKSLKKLRAPILCIFTLIAASVFYLGCEKPQVINSTSTPATVGGIQFTILPYQLKILELDSSNGAVKYAKPVMIIPIKMKNVGTDPFLYNPEHATQQMTESTTPLLYIEPQGKDVKLPPEQKTIINGAYLEAGKLPEQLENRTTIAPGQEITDYYLFEYPGKTEENMILSIPPSMDRSKLPLLFKLHYTPTKPEGPQLYSEGEAVKLDNATFTVTGHKMEYVQTTDANQGKGFTSQPLLRIDFTVKNDGSAPIMYNPDHRIVGQIGPGLFGVSRTLERVRLQPTVEADGQLNQPTEIPPGGSISDYLLFIPPVKKQELKLEYPASLFGQTGVARVMIDVDPTDPGKPKDMTTPRVIIKKAGGDDGDDADGGN